MKERIQLALGIFMVLSMAFYTEQFLINSENETGSRTPASKIQANEKVNHNSFVEIEKFYHQKETTKS